ncbi:MAG: hypothetical protein K2L99_08600, partial [Muribaculaceae bacterium]|nr:hypothetical protein [Muribaculaceae bacterium]
MRKILALITLVAAVLTVSAAPLPEYVKWSARIDSVAPDRGTVVVTAAMADGWHIYGFEKPADDAGMYPTQLTVEASAGVKLADAWTPSRPAAEHIDALLQLRLTWWDGTVSFSRDFTTSGAQGADIKVTAAYMVCNDRSCTAPASTTMNLRFGAPSATPAAEHTAVEAAPAPDAPAAAANAWWAPGGPPGAPAGLPARALARR